MERRAIAWALYGPQPELAPRGGNPAPSRSRFGRRHRAGPNLTQRRRDRGEVRSPKATPFLRTLRLRSKTIRHGVEPAPEERHVCSDPAPYEPREPRRGGTVRTRQHRAAPTGLTLVLDVVCYTHVAPLGLRTSPACATVQRRASHKPPATASHRGSRPYGSKAISASLSRFSPQ